MLVEIENRSSNLFITQTTAGSRDTNKHSKDISAVTLHPSRQDARWLAEFAFAHPLRVAALAMLISIATRSYKKRCCRQSDRAVSLPITYSSQAALNQQLGDAGECATVYRIWIRFQILSAGIDFDIGGSLPKM